MTTVINIDSLKHHPMYLEQLFKTAKSINRCPKGPTFNYLQINCYKSFGYFVPKKRGKKKKIFVEETSSCKTKLSITHHSKFELPKAVAASGFPRPMVKPLVPSGILGPFVVCLAQGWRCLIAATGQAQPLWLWL